MPRQGVAVSLSGDAQTALVGGPGGSGGAWVFVTQNAPISGAGVPATTNESLILLGIALAMTGVVLTRSHGGQG